MVAATATISSPTTGTTTINASVSVSAGPSPNPPFPAQVTLTRTTNGVGANSGPATKNWADDTVRTDIHDAAHTVITTANAGDVVHDKVLVAKAAGTPAGVPDPTGNVVFHRYTTIDCTGAAVDETVALTPDRRRRRSRARSRSRATCRTRRDYAGDANYPAHDGCVRAAAGDDDAAVSGGVVQVHVRGGTAT